MRQLTAKELLDLKFDLFVKETNEVYEDTMEDDEGNSLCKYDADGYIIYNTPCGIVLSFNWMAVSTYEEKGGCFDYAITPDCHDPEFKLENAELINEDDSLMNETEVYHTLFDLIDSNISFEQVIEKDLPPAACGE